MQRPEEESEKHACIKAEEAYRSSCITPGNVGIDIVVHLCHSVTSERNCSFYNVRNVAKNESTYVVGCFRITCMELFRFIPFSSAYIILSRIRVSSRFPCNPHDGWFHPHVFKGFFLFCAILPIKQKLYRLVSYFR